MLNTIHIEGVVLKTWRYSNIPFAQLVNRPDPGVGVGDMLFIARLPATAMGIEAGDQLRLQGKFFNRRKKEDGDEYVGEIHVDRVVRVARNQLHGPRKSRKPRRRARKAELKAEPKAEPKEQVAQAAEAA